MEIQWLTVGYIQKNSSQERIVCGDPEDGKTIEINLSICGNKITAIESTAEIEVDPAGFFKENLMLWEQISKTFFKDIFPRIPDSNKLFNCYLIFINELEDSKGIYLLAGEDEMGEFNNENGCYDDTFYLRYQLEDDENFFNEKVLGFNT